ncbi:MAG: hypothetical protein JNM56_10315 [Planctomycetia bacterium]|nr:hypothetical protein [Planctomycetia bacterium]
MRTITVREAGAPPGEYLAQLVAITDTSHVEYGPGLRFEFEILTGEYVGRRVSRVTCAQSTRLNNLGRMLAGLLGRPLMKDEDVDLDQFIGRDYTVTVEKTETGSTRVATVQPAPSV